MSRFKQGYFAIIGILMVGAFVYLRVSLMLRQPETVLPQSVITSSTDVHRLYNIPDLRSANPDFYAQAQEGDVEVTYEDKVLIYRPTTKQIIIERPKQ
ncbi:hypothetical protein IT407_02340 [Candidatus Uhrbacteria bacterium]|nr:hypothetical protein [Candidatus Uhrbacteria bacterium]